MILDELTPYRREDPANIRMEGPHVALNSQCAVMLGMIVHELATNAAKYGALSAEHGELDVSWRLDQETHQLVVNWIERGGPAVEPPTRSGFGRLLLERALPSSLMGNVDLRYDPEGLRASLQIPLPRVLRSDTERVEDRLAAPP